MMKSRIDVSVGIFVHNEEKNIGNLLESIKIQKTKTVAIKEIIVISSGSFDKTNEIVKGWQKKLRKLKLVTETHRKGKATSINTFLRQAKSPIVITISGDIVLDKHAIEEVGILFEDKSVGMVGAHPIPVNTDESSIGDEVQLLWELHHRLALMHPKCGEMVAFRNIVHEIPTDSAVDEATLEVLLKLLGYKIAYAPRSIVYNKGPVNVGEFVTQRRRVFTGHQWIESKYNYQVSTMDQGQIFSVMMDYLYEHPKDIGVATKLVLLEGLTRLMGWSDYHLLGRNPYKWKMISR